MRMLKTFFRELTTQSNTAFSLGTRLIVLRGLKVGCSEFVIWRNQRRFKTNLIEAKTWALEELAMIWSCWGFALSSSPWNEQQGDALTPTEFAKFGIELYLFTIITVINVFLVIFKAYANIHARRAQQTTIASMMFQKSLPPMQFRLWG